MNRTIFCRDIKITDKGFEVKASMDFRNFRCCADEQKYPASGKICPEM